MCGCACVCVGVCVGVGVRMCRCVCVEWVEFLLLESRSTLTYIFRGMLRGT